MTSYEPQSEPAGALPDTEQRAASYYVIRGLPVFGLLAVAAAVVLYQQNEAVHAVLQAAGEGVTSSGFWKAAGVGLFAQIVDGALGMAYGITSTSFLLSVGVPPAAASASVHLAEVFTTGFSGFSHWRLGNVNKGLFKRLLIPGIIGGVVGACCAGGAAAGVCAGGVRRAGGPTESGGRRGAAPPSSRSGRPWRPARGR